MKNLIHLIILFIATSVGIIKAQDSITSYDGQTFKAGDKIQFGYHYITSSKYVTIRNGYVNEYNRKVYDDMEEGELPFSMATVQKAFYPENTDIFHDKDPILLVKSEKSPGKEIYIHINRAIYRGEVISSIPDKKMFEDAVELTLEQIFACCVRVNKLTVDDNTVLNYIGTIDKKLQSECISNKFKFEKIKDEYKARLEDSMNNIDFSSTYYFKTKNYHDNYDFTLKGYPIGYNLHNPKGSKNFPLISHEGFNFALSNPDAANFLPLDADAAEKYELRVKGPESRGYVSQLIYTIVYLILTDKRIDIPQEKHAIFNAEKLYRHTIIGAKAKGIEVYDHPSFQYNLIGSRIAK